MSSDEELEDGDGLDEFNNVSSRQTVDEAFESSDGKLPRYNRTGPGSPVTGPPMAKLADERWIDLDRANPRWHLAPNEECDVIRLAKADDPAAKRRLVECWQKTMLKEAGLRIYDGPLFDDRLNAAWEGFWKALAGFSLQRNNGFYAYAIKFIRGAIVDCVNDWHTRGLKNESLAARKDRAAHKPVYSEYNSIEQSFDQGGRDDDGERYGNGITGHISADDSELRECDGSGGKFTDADWNRIVAGRAVPTNYPRWWAPKEPCKPISRARYTEDRLQAYRYDTAAFVQRHITLCHINLGDRLGIPRECFGVDADFRRRGNCAPALGIIGFLARSSDRRDARWLNAMGRRAYALWLVRKDIKRRLKESSVFRVVCWKAREIGAGKCAYYFDLAAIETSPHIFEVRRMADYSISVNTARTAVTVEDSKKWQSDMDRLRAAAEVLPTVYDEKDKRWGWYMARKSPPSEIETATTADADERTEDEIRTSYPRHQDHRMLRSNGSSGGPARSSSSGQEQDVGRDANRAA